jgi:hypothetical protein
MIIGEYSKQRIHQTFADWEVPKDFAEPIYGYLVFGWEPGSCFTAVLANDFLSAMGSSHSANSVDAFKSLAGWIRNKMPIEAYGSYFAVKHWLGLEEEDRRRVLENHQLIYTAKQDTWLAIKGEPLEESWYFS